MNQTTLQSTFFMVLLTLLLFLSSASCSGRGEIKAIDFQEWQKIYLNPKIRSWVKQEQWIPVAAALKRQSSKHYALSFLEGYALWKQNQKKEALFAFLKSASAQKGDSTPKRIANQEIVTYMRTTTLSPLAPYAAIYISDILQDFGLYNGSMAVINLFSDVENPFLSNEFQRLTGEKLIFEKQYEKASAIFHHLAERFTVNRLKLATIYNKQGQSQKAVDQYRIILQGENPFWMKKIASREIAKNSKEFRQEPSILCQAAIILFQSGLKNEAKQILDSIAIRDQDILFLQARLEQRNFFIDTTWPAVLAEKIWEKNQQEAGTIFINSQRRLLQKKKYRLFYSQANDILTLFNKHSYKGEFFTKLQLLVTLASRGPINSNSILHESFQIFLKDRSSRPYIDNVYWHHIFHFIKNQDWIKAASFSKELWKNIPPHQLTERLLFWSAISLGANRFENLSYYLYPLLQRDHYSYYSLLAAIYLQNNNRKKFTSLLKDKTNPILQKSNLTLSDSTVRYLEKLNILLASKPLFHYLNDDVNRAIAMPGLQQEIISYPFSYKQHCPQNDILLPDLSKIFEGKNSPSIDAGIFAKIGLYQIADDILERNLSKEQHHLLLMSLSSHLSDADQSLLQALKIFKTHGNYRICSGTLKKILKQSAFAKPYKNIVESASSRFHVDPELIWAIMKAESAFIERISSSAGAIGLMQLMPLTGQPIAKRLGFDPPNLNDPEISILSATNYIRQQNRRFGGNLLWLSSAYNAGPGTAIIWERRYSSENVMLLGETIPFLETREYYKKIFANYVNYMID